MAKKIDVDEAALHLRKAMEGFGTNEKVLIKTLAGLDSETLKDVKKSFEKQFHRDLEKDINSETSGHFGDLMDLIIKGPVELDAFLLMRSMKGIGTNDSELIEVLVSRPADHLKEVRKYFASHYKGSLDEWIAGDTSGHYKDFLLRLASGDRAKASAPLVKEDVAADVKNLYRAGEGKVGTNEGVFIEFFATRSPKHIRHVVEEYAKEYSHSLETAIKKEFSGDLERGLQWALEYMRDHQIFFAKRLHHSLKGAGTHDRDLTRIVATRREVDLYEIEGAYEKIFGHSLKEDVASDTSGHYKDLLLEIIKGAE